MRLSKGAFLLQSVRQTQGGGSQQPWDVSLEEARSRTSCTPNAVSWVTPDLSQSYV